MARVRIFSSVARLAVMVAIAPESKTICTVATSVTCDCTEEPTAVILRGSPSTRPRTMSMSWIIRSITTESFCTRGTKGPSRRDSMRMGRSTILRSSCTAPLKRSTWPTWSTRFCSRATRRAPWPPRGWRSWASRRARGRPPRAGRARPRSAGPWAPPPSRSRSGPPARGDRGRRAPRTEPRPAAPWRSRCPPPRPAPRPRSRPGPGYGTGPCARRRPPRLGPWTRRPGSRDPLLHRFRAIAAGPARAGDDPALGRLHELHEARDERVVAELRPDPLDRGAGRHARAVEEAEGRLHLPPRGGVDPAAAHAHHVDRARDRGGPVRDDEGRDVLGDLGTAADVGIGADAAEGMDAGEAPDRRA